MEVAIRPARVFCRLIRKTPAITSCRHITGTAVKEEVNTELLNTFNQDILAGGAVPVFRRALLFPTRVALQDEVGIYTYAGLHQAASDLCQEISAHLLGESERTICYMCSNDASHVIVQWAIWMSGNIAVPLTPLHPPDMLKYFVTDSMANLIICTQEYENIIKPIAIDAKRTLLVTDRDKEIKAQLYQPNSAFLKPKPEDTLTDVGRTNAWYGGNDALIIYTSGTTSKPKGVVWSHSMVQAQVASLHAAWRYCAGDVVLHALPLHHIHGQLNSMLASLAAGARIRMLRTFASHAVWARLLGMGERDETKVTVFHAVPAMYARLAADHARMFTNKRTAEYVRTSLKSRMRLMCAGSASLPETLFKKWEEISGLRLLERYGMSEAGMALSNPYRPVQDRTLGAVGAPLPGVAARIAAPRGDSGQLQPLVTVETPDVSNQISLSNLGLQSPKESLEEPKDFQWQEPKVTRHEQSEDDVYQGELLLKGPGVFTRYWNRTPTLDSKDFTPDGWFRTGDTASYSDEVFRILGRTSVDIIKTSGYKVSALQVESVLLEHPSIADAAVLGIEDENQGEIVTAVVVLKEKAVLTLKELKTEAGKKLAPYQLPKNMLVVNEMPRNVMGKLDKKVIRQKFGEQLVMKKDK